jgi:hypothetical protein
VSTAGSDSLELDVSRNPDGNRAVRDRAVAELSAVIRPPTEDDAVACNRTRMRETGNQCREFQIASDSAWSRVRDCIRRSVAELTELVRSPAVRVAAICKRAGVICASRDRDETERLGEREGIDMNAHRADDDQDKSAKSLHRLY